MVPIILRMWRNNKALFGLHNETKKMSIQYFVPNNDIRFGMKWKLYISTKLICSLWNLEKKL